MIKLPEDKNERNKLYAVIGIFVVGGLYLGFSFGLKPLIQKAQQKTERIEQLDDLIWKAERSLNDLANNRRRNAEAVADIQSQTERQQYVIGHNLGNYLLVARGIVDAYAAASGITLTSVQELTTVTHLPARTKAKPGAPAPTISRYVAYRVGISFSASLVETVSFVNHCHDQNPLLCITKLTIDAVPSTPQRHAVTMELEWPRWRSDDERLRLTENAAKNYLMQIEENEKETRP
jgi:hypothetical protein